jgi:hypothetical protein
MSLLNLYNTSSHQNSLELSQEFQALLANLKTHVDNYLTLKDKAMKERMIIIGMANAYRAQFPQRSTESRLLLQALNREWSSDVIKNNTQAYLEYQRLMASSVDDWKNLAEKANPSQLLLFSRDKSGKLRFEAAKTLKQTGKIPSFQQLNQSRKMSGSRSPITDTGSEKRNVTPLQETNSQPAHSHPRVEDQELELEFKRIGVTNELQQTHLVNLVSNENLQHIQTVRQAFFWQCLSDDDLMNLVEQKLLVSNRFELRLREKLRQHQEELTKTQRYEGNLNTQHLQATSSLEAPFKTPRFRR